VKLLDAIQELEKNKASELFFSDILDYVNSIKDGENEIFDINTLDLIEDSIIKCSEFLEKNKKACYASVTKISNLEIKNETNRKRKVANRTAPPKGKRGSKKV
jgi:hypothetical protein